MTVLRTRADEVRALAELRAEIHAAGLDRQTPLLSLSILAVHVVLMFGGLIVFVVAEPLWLRLVALALSTYGALGVGMTGHNASHYTVTGNKHADRAVTYFTMALCHGISACYWRVKHIRLHHVAPNNNAFDTDHDLLPFFALSQEDVDKATGWQRKLHRVQHVVFPFAVSLNMLNLKIWGLRHIRSELMSPRRWRASLWIDIACVSTHFTALVVVPAFFWPLWQVVAFFLMREALHGYIMFAAAAPPHFPAEAKFVKADPHGPGVLAGQVYTTVNYRTGFFGRLACLGAEYQIEHHLVPEINPLKSNQVSEIVRKFCARYGYPYRSFGWWEGIVKAVQAVAHPKPIEHIEDLIAAPESKAA
jgi:fatty acid desaturase